MHFENKKKSSYRSEYFQMQFKVLSRVVEGQHEGFKTATMVLYMTNIIEILYKAPGFHK